MYRANAPYPKTFLYTLFFKRISRTIYLNQFFINTKTNFRDHRLLYFFFNPNLSKIFPEMNQNIFFRVQ